jgi:hypothetical protein
MRVQGVTLMLCQLVGHTPGLAVDAAERMTCERGPGVSFPAE